MLIYNNILELKELFDVFIFDAFGVFWDGFNLYDDALNTFEKLKQINKKIIILSNTTKISVKQEEQYQRAGLLKGKHYDFLITAGEYTRYILENQLLSFKENEKPKNYYTIGIPNKDLFKNTKYINVDSVEQADFVYLSTLGITKEEYEVYSDEDKKYLVQLKSTNDNSYRMTKFEIIIPKIKRIFGNIKLPCFSSNPDMTAFDTVKEINDRVQICVVGRLSEYLRNEGFEVLDFGKPNVGIFEYALKTINDINKNRICMVGDTLKTDILGANNIGIKSVLCLKTGITYTEIEKGRTIEELEKEANVKIDYIINKL